MRRSLYDREEAFTRYRRNRGASIAGWVLGLSVSGSVLLAWWLLSKPIAPWAVLSAAGLLGVSVGWALYRAMRV